MGITSIAPVSTFPGRTKGIKDKLRSILAQFKYQHRLQQWEQKGVEFRTYLYVPEVHPETNEEFCEREDEAHVLKVCITAHVIFNCADTHTN